MSESTIAFESVSRHVRDLDAAVAFYAALGFTPAPAAASTWGADAEHERLWDVGGAQWRTATVLLPSAVSPRQFPVHLREFRGRSSRDWTAIDPWATGSGHLGLGVEDPNRTWDELEAAGQLRPQTRGGRPLPMPDEFRDEAERHVERPFAAFLDPDGLLVEIQPNRRAHPSTPNWIELADETAGFSHFNLNVPDMDAAGRFLEALGLELPVGPFESFAHPWLTDLFGTPQEDDEGWNIVYARLPEADAGGALISIELIEFHGLAVDAGYAAAQLCDPGVTLLTFAVTGLDALVTQALAAGATAHTPGGAVTLEDGSRSVVLRAPGFHAFLELRGS